MASTTSTPQKPRLRIRRATPADVPDIVRIHFGAFGPGVMGRLMNPDGISESARVRFGASLLPDEEEAQGPAGAAAAAAAAGAPPKEGLLLPDEKFIMVAETDGDGDGEGAQSGPGQIVAFAKWRMVREQLPEDKYARSDEMTVEELGEGTNVEVYNAFIGGLHRIMAKWWKGEPCLYLHILAADPARQRLGAGSALLAWGAALADREGRPSWLEASPQGYPLYRRFGYEDVDVQDVAVTERWGPTRAGGEDWGQGSAVALAGALREGCFRSVVMRRSPPRGLEGGSSSG